MKSYVWIIPAYKKKPDADEEQCMARYFQVLTEGDPFFVVPENLNLGWYKEHFPKAGFECFPDRYFKNVDGYNHLLLSDCFYQRFERYAYMLIAQPDAVVWQERDRIPEFIEMGYDYYGAPWVPERRIWEWTFPKKEGFPGFRIRCCKTKGDGITMGNGGFSLRHIAHTRELIRQYRWRKCYWFIKRNEDIFFGVFGSDNRNAYRLADVETGKKFALEYDLKKNVAEGHVPFAVHGWSKEFADYGQMREYLREYHIEI